MKNKIVLLGLVHLTFVCSITAQSLSEQQKEKFVAVPAEQVMVMNVKFADGSTYEAGAIPSGLAEIL